MALLLPFIIFLLIAVLSVFVYKIKVSFIIGKELKKHGYNLTSITNTNKTFIPERKTTREFWKNFIIMDYSSAQVTQYKMVTFSIGKEKFSSVVAIDTFFFLFHQITFEKDLNKLKQNLNITSA